MRAADVLPRQPIGENAVWVSPGLEQRLQVRRFNRAWTETGVLPRRWGRTKFFEKRFMRIGDASGHVKENLSFFAKFFGNFVASNASSTLATGTSDVDSASSDLRRLILTRVCPFP